MQTLGVLLGILGYILTVVFLILMLKERREKTIRDRLLKRIHPHRDTINASEFPESRPTTFENALVRFFAATNISKNIVNTLSGTGRMTLTDIAMNVRMKIQDTNLPDSAVKGSITMLYGSGFVNVDFGKNEYWLTELGDHLRQRIDKY